MLNTNYVSTARYYEVRKEPEDTKFEELKSILKTYAKEIGSSLSLFAEEEVMGYAVTKLYISKNCTIDLMSLNVTRPLLAPETAELAVVIRFIEGETERIFSEVIKMNAAMLKKFRHMCEILDIFHHTTGKQKPAKTIKTSNKKVPNFTQPEYLPAVVGEDEFKEI